MKKRIYIADDNSGLIDMMAVFLEGMGYEADGSPELLNLLLLDTINLPDVFLLNIRVWGEDSEMISSYLKTNELTGNIPVILFTTLQRSVQHPLDRYADGFIYIPFEINQLSGLLKKVTS
jgi:CheY-like chemotaxis protein